MKAIDVHAHFGTYDIGDGPGARVNLITDDLPGGFEAVAADLDGDGDLDVVATGETPGEVAWFEIRAIRPGAGRSTASRRTGKTRTK